MKEVNLEEEEFAFCDSPFTDFDRCPLSKQRNNCENCKVYNVFTQKVDSITKDQVK